ncbi:FtsX-like permease family protein [Cellulomonas sp. HZM]|uniref:FtsX-like permease family protein n=1 Tax=Cellulomonas sp. HZM TaxID=1454010 RepID=UPI0004935F9D|nr:ABC transporter permease [Cellulomonas sp. HZM]
MNAGWNARLLVHRARAQQTLLLTVLAVAVVATTLLGTFTVLLAVSQDHMLGVALGRTSDADRELDAVVTPINTLNGPDVIAHSTAFLDETLGDLPARRETWLASAMYSVQGTDDAVDPYAYLASEPLVRTSSRVVQGAFPTDGVDAHGNVEVAVPEVAAREYGWAVGDVVRVVDAAARTPATFVVTGTFRLEGPSASWARDVLGGTEHDPAYPVLGTGGMLRTQAWGPFVTAGDDVFTDGTSSLGLAHLVAWPDLAGADAGRLDGLRARVGDARQRLAAATQDDFTSTYVATRLDRTIDTAVTSLRVTQVIVTVVALLLVVLAVTVLLLAARLLAERRAPEQALMASRGASGRQLLGLAVLEALAVAAVTAAAAPWLAVALYRVVTSRGALRDSGLHVDPGLPARLWVVCALAALGLAAVLVAPLLRRRAVDGEQPDARQDRRSTIARSGGDLALVLLAGVALWQLGAYRSPVGGAAAVDPVLVLAPALVLLAGAVLALRLMPLVAHVGERLAARSRSLVAPLAAWELGRRPGRATAAVLLLTLAVGAGTFSLSFLATWRTSQQDQADLAVGADLRVVPSGTTIETSAVLDAHGLSASAHPASRQDVTVGAPSADPREDTGGVAASLLALGTAGDGDVLRGRVDGGWAGATAGLAPTGTVDGVPLPGRARYLVVDVRSTMTSPGPGSTSVQLVVQDASGARSTLALPAVDLVGSVDDVVVPLPAAARGLSLVAVVVHLTPAADDTVPATDTVVTVQLRDLRTAAGPEPGDDGPPAADDLTGVQDVAFDSGTWAKATGARATARALRTHGTLHGGTWWGTPETLVATTFAAPEAPVPALVTPDLLTTIGTDVGDPLRLSVGGALVDVDVRGTVPYLPGLPSGSGVLVDSDALGRAAIASGQPAPSVDEWWVTVPDDEAAAAVDGLRSAHVGDVVSRAEARAAATDGPLRVGVPAALWIVVVAALALALAGLAMSATVSVRMRRLELARLQAVGAPRGGLVRSVLVEHGVLAAVGGLVGLALGTLLGRVVAPLVTVSSAGTAPVPGVVVLWGWRTQGVLVGTLVVVGALVVALTTNALLRRASGELLRLGDER